MKNSIVKLKHALTFSSLFFLAACGGSNSNDPTSPKVTFLSMIAPSPDWFVGAHIETLLADGKFVDTITVDVLAYDAGTDDGNSYQSADDDTQPKGVIQGLITDPIHTSFTSEAARKIGTLTFTKQ